MRRETTWSEQQQLTSEALYGLGPNLAVGTNGIIVDAPSSGGSFVYEPQAQWQSMDVGPVGLRGNYTASTNALLVSGAGADIGGNADAFHFVFRPWSGDLEALVKVRQTSGTDDWARGGIMLRESLDPGSPEAFISLRQGGSTVGTFNPVQIGPAQPPVLFVSLPRTNGTAQIQVGSLPGWMNAVEVSSDLIHWSVWEQRISTSGFLTFTGDMLTANPKLFYRAVILP